MAWDPKLESENQPMMYTQVSEKKRKTPEKSSGFFRFSPLATVLNAEVLCLCFGHTIMLQENRKHRMQSAASLHAILFLWPKPQTES